MQFVRSILFALLFYPATFIYVLSGMAASLIGTGAVRAVVHGWSDFHNLLVRRLLRIRIEIEGELPPGPLLIAAKHESMFETIEVLRIARTPVVVLKHELSSLPLFGWLTRRYGVIPVEREAGARALREMVALGKAAIAEGRPVVIFPEGTRVPHGQTPPLRPGFAGLYRALGLPVVPIALDSGRLWTRGLLKRSGTIHFSVGETIPPGLKRDEIENRVHSALNTLNRSAS